MTDSTRTRLLVILGVALLLAPLLIRFWLRRLYAGLTNGAHLDHLAGSGWPIEHVFAATDLGDHGSFFIVTNSIQPQMCSTRHGLFDGRHVSFVQALRATTAFPPVVPPLRLHLHPKPGSRVSPLDGTRRWIWSPYPRASSMIRLADGGLTGNLGIQFDARIAPDNVALLDVLGAKTKADTPTRPMPYDCPHGEIAWICTECRTATVIVDCTAPPRRSPKLGVLLAIPLLGPLVLALRSLQVLYESSFVDDQDLAGDPLVGVVRSEQIAQRLAIKNSPLSHSKSAPERMRAAGAFLHTRERLTDPELRRVYPGMTQLLLACFAARDEAAKLRTSLFAVNPRRAARVVASGYLNACLNHHGPGAFATADAGIHKLSSLLGPRARLDEWWDDITRQTDLARD